jgi:hypothetical protein
MSPTTGRVPYARPMRPQLRGSGTKNYVAKFINPTTLGNSLIFDDGTNVGRGTAHPTDKLDVRGNIKLGQRRCAVWSRWREKPPYPPRPSQPRWVVVGADRAFGCQARDRAIRCNSNDATPFPISSGLRTINNTRSGVANSLSRSARVSLIALESSGTPCGCAKPMAAANRVSMITLFISLLSSAGCRRNYPAISARLPAVT